MLKPISEDKKFLDPAQLTEADLPIIILEEDRQGMFGGLIKWKTASNYNHIETMVHLGLVQTQDPGGYREIPIEKCLAKRVVMKFWKFDPLLKNDKDLFIQKVEKDLKEPWWIKQYDFLGIIGQAFGLRWIQTPWTKFCSERVASQLRVIDRFKTLPKQPNPSELNEIFKILPEFKVLGYWWDRNAD